MLSQISRLPPDVLTLILYSGSASLENIALRRIREHFEVASNYYITCSSEKELRAAKSSANIAPLSGKKWLVVVDADKVDPKVIEKDATTVYDSCILIYRTSQYRVFKRLSGAKFVKTLRRYCISLYGGKLLEKDIWEIVRYYGVSLDEKVVKFLFSKYNRCPEEVCTLCANAKSGYSVESEADIIRLIGLGDINVASFVVTMLESRPKSVVGRKRQLKSRLQYLESLASNLGYASIQNFIVDTLDGFIDIKTSQIAGDLHITGGFEAPDGYSEKRANRFNRLLRYFDELNRSISLEYLLWARDMFKRNPFQPKQAVLSWVLNLYSFVGLQDGEVQKPRQGISTVAPDENKMDLSAYTAWGTPVIQLKRYTPKGASVKVEAAPVKVEAAPVKVEASSDLSSIYALLFNEEGKTSDS